MPPRRKDDYMTNEREEYYKEMCLLDKKIVYPQYNDKCKDTVFKCISEQKIKDSTEYIGKLFNENSELYQPDEEGICINSYDVEGILENINYNRNGHYFDRNLSAIVRASIDELYFEELKRLNPDVDHEVFCDLPSYDPQELWYATVDHITIDELKEAIYQAINDK